MARNISIYARILELQNHEDAKLYHIATLGIKEDEKYVLSKDKIENFCMGIFLGCQAFHWDEVMMIPSQKIQYARQPVLCLTLLNVNRNSNTYHWCHNHNKRKGMWVDHLPDECRASDKSND